ncbi:MAG: hypothetical protein AABY05_02075 [Nanoarchaeota archaeon]
MKIKASRERKFEAIIQIVLLIGSIISFGYLIRDFSDNIVSAVEISDSDVTNIQNNVRNEGQDPNQLLNLDNNFINRMLNSFVPQAPSINSGDFLNGINSNTGGVKVCTKTKDNKICQQITGNSCQENCEGECLDGTLKTLPENSVCSLGTCIDKTEGICSSESPKKYCEDLGGEWKHQEEDSIPECVKGCCHLADQPIFTTEGSCKKQAESHGLEFGVGADFNGEIVEEYSCLISFEGEKEGACVFSVDDESKKGCKLTTKTECETLTERNDNFFEDVLCSNPDLGTSCLRQNSTNCIEGLDEIYWFDSCGNKENIYSSITDQSWNEGKILKNVESCTLGEPGDWLKNQGICGNCDRLQGSICGNKTAEQKLDDATQGVVCLDTSCVDDSGKRRENGESWCAYQSSIGLPGPDVPGLDSLRNSITNPALSFLAGARATDTPGSLHFRKFCNNGKIEISACDNYRNQICVEEQTPKEETEDYLSQASCRLNRWQECLAYNPGSAEARLMGFAGKNAGNLLKAKLELTCGLDPDCFVKTVDMIRDKEYDTFKFSYCAPRYPPGFDMKDNPDAANQLCAQASQQCTVVYVNMLIEGWTCKGNCECEKPTFAKEMNDLCTSLGDCGSEVNYLGNQPGGKGYIITTKDKKDLWSNLGGLPFGDLFGGGFGIGNLANPLDAEPIKEEYIPLTQPEILDKIRHSWIVETFGSLDISRILSGDADSGTPNVETNNEKGGISAGLIVGGTGATALAAAYAFPSSLAVGGGFSHATVIGSIPNPALAGFGGGALGAGLGLAVTGFLIKMLGIGPGLPAAATYALMGTGAVAGALVGYQYATAGTFCAGGPLGCMLAVAVLLIIVFLKILGIGEVKEKKIMFECRPWVAPTGEPIGKCEQCGKDKLSDGAESFPCNKYSCQSIAQNCKYILETEGTAEHGGGLCVTADINDVSPPRIIDVWKDVLTTGYSYSEKPYDQGFSIEKNSGGCMNQFEQLKFGFILDEYGWCRISGERKEKFEEMTAIGGISQNQSFVLSGYDLSSLSIEGLKSEEKNDISLYVVCEDAVGKTNIDKPYIINLCVDPKDLTAPVINNVNSGGDVLPYNTETQTVNVYTDEKSECKWSYNEGVFGDLPNSMTCNIDDGDRDVRGFECRSEVVLQGETTSICIKCKDHPEWQNTENENRRNENSECIKIELKKSNSELKIDSIYPNNVTITTGRNIPSLTIKTSTSGGLDGNADCFFSLDNSPNELMFETGTNIHKQILGTGTSSLQEKFYSLKLRCVDKANNVATNTTSFEIKRDLINPNIARIYENSRRLYVVTDEPSQCAFLNKPIKERKNACNFNVDEALEIGNIISIEDSSQGYLHGVEFDTKKPYYLRCKDLYGNEKTGECDIVVKGGFV